MYLKVIAYSIIALFITCSLIDPDDEPHLLLLKGNIISYSLESSLHLMDIDTGETETIADSVEGEVRWSPDRSMFAYTVSTPWTSAPSWIYIANADGSEKRNITLMERKGRMEPNLWGGGSPVWSPDGTRIAFHRCLDCELGGGNYEIFIVDIDTSGGFKELRLTDNYNSDGIQDWSPDGEKIIFRSTLTVDGVYDHDGAYYTMDIDGLNKTFILENDIDGFGGGAFRYSPDGKLIAFVGGTNNSNSQLYIMKADGSNIRQVTTNSISEMQLSWSPDGEKLLFTATKTTYRDGGNIYIINIDGTGFRQITEGSPKDFDSPEWVFQK